MTILLAGFLLIIIASAIILYKSHKKVAVILISIPITMVVLLFGWWVYETNYYFVKSTDLGEEFVGDIELNQSLASYEKSNPAIKFTKGENVYYPTYLTSPYLTIGANENDEIEFVSSSFPEHETSRGIQVNDDEKLLIQTYGDNYDKGREMGIGEYLIYVDRNAKRTLCFWIESGKVRSIDFGKM